MTTTEMPPEVLLPPKRLGTLLAEARLGGGYTLVEAADALGSDWSPVELLEVETGRRPVLDPDLKVLSDLYGIATTSLIPERSRLVIDLEEGVLGVGPTQVTLGGDGAAQEQEVLTQYLAMVYTMRDLRPGLEVPLRTPDLDVLSTALQRPTDTIEAELRQMMIDAGAVVEPRMRRLRGRVLIPAVGLIVAATTAGLLLLVNDSDARPATEGSGVSASETYIGDAVVQERLPDGTPGPVEVRD